MHTRNVCAGLKVENLSSNTPTLDMLQMQYKLQDYMGKLPQSTPTPAQAVTMVIYWRQCIHSECDELLEWFDDEPDAPELELEMEAIDILHFVFNLGITFLIPPEVLEAELIGHSFIPQETRLQAIESQLHKLSRSLTKLIDHLPWKAWKTYEPSTKFPYLLSSYAAVVSEAYQVCALLNMDMDRILSVYTAKNKENYARQERGY